MQEVGHNATSLLGKLSCHFRTRGSRFPDRKPAAQRWPFTKPAPSLIARSALRFAYIARPAKLGSHAFLSSCLLHASHQAPFVRSGHFALHDRQGAAIWWWDEDALACSRPDRQLPAGELLPEPVCQDLPDGFHHLYLEEGFEARCVRQGMIVGSVWRRTPFDRQTWLAFLESHSATPGQRAAGLPIATDPPPIERLRPVAGRRLSQPVHPRHQLLGGILLATVMTGAWWHGESAALRAETLKLEADSRRLTAIVRNYSLMVTARQDLADISQARAALAKGIAAAQLAQILRLAANRGVQVSEIRIDGETLDMVVFAQNEPARIRALASDIESLPELAAVVGTSGPEAGQIRLSAKAQG